MSSWDKQRHHHIMTDPVVMVGKKLPVSAVSSVLSDTIGQEMAKALFVSVYWKFIRHTIFINFPQVPPAPPQSWKNARMNCVFC
jgi:hypothetical protein